MIDAVYTWVDDEWPGYREQLQRYASDRGHDLNPNRTRDNLETVRYSLRSLERFVPWVRQVFLVTCRPQVPAWLNPAAVRLVHHDEFIGAATLPTFSSFAIVSQLHRIDGLAPRFIYIEDDRMFGAPVRPGDLFDAAGRPRVFLKWRHAIDPSRHNDAHLSPWNRALAYSNYLLNERFGPKRRRTVSHAPLPIELDSWHAMHAAWPDAFAHTASSRFRSTGDVAPEHLYPHFVAEEYGVAPAPGRATLAMTAYHPLNNMTLLQRANFLRLRAQHPTFICLNDNYGDRPQPRAVAIARRFLEESFPKKSRFER